MITLNDQIQRREAGKQVKALPLVTLGIGLVTLSSFLLFQESEVHRPNSPATGPLQGKAPDDTLTTQPSAHSLIDQRTQHSAPRNEASNEQAVTPSTATQDPGLSLLEVALKTTTAYTLSSGLARAAQDGDYNALFNNPFLVSIINPDKVLLSDPEKQRIFSLYKANLQQIKTLRDAVTTTQRRAIERLADGGQTEPTIKLPLKPGEATSETTPQPNEGEEIVMRTIGNKNHIIRIRPGDAPDYDSSRAALLRPTKSLLESIRREVIKIKEGKVK
jgi:hypothetical protein